MRTMATPAKYADKTPTELKAELARKDAAAARRRTMTRIANQRMTGQLTRSGAASALAFGGGFLFEKNPRLKTLDAGGKIPTDLVLAGAGLAGALFTDGLISDALEGVAMGRGMPYLNALGARRAAGG
jgi:hypothetical protein